jgi:hypothetical protein
MKSNLLTFTLLITGALSSFAQPANLNISNTQAFEGEPYLAVNPTNTNNIIIAWMALDLSTNFKVSIKSKASFDGGATWGNQRIQPHISAAWHSADVSMAFRTDGTAYMTYIDYRESPDSGGVFMVQSIDGGKNWSAPVRIWNTNSEDPAKVPLDRPWVAIDNSATASAGHLYLTTKPAPWIPAPNRPYLKSSSDHGQTWTPFRYVDTTGFLVGNQIQAPMAFPAVAADGALCIAFPSYLPAQGLLPKFILAKSYNGGASFTYHTMVQGATSATDPNYKLGYRLVANPANANQLALAYITSQNGDPDIFVITTNDGGINWSAPKRINDDPLANGKAQDLVWVSYGENGKLALTWRDRRNGTGTGFFQPSDAYCAVSSDNGATFQPNFRLSSMTAPFDSILLQNGNDFMSCELRHDTIYAAWGDVRNGHLNIWFTKASANSGMGSGVTLINPEGVNPLRVFPNPASGRVFVQLDGVVFRHAEATLMGEDGTVLLTTGIYSGQSVAEFDLSRQPSGVYVVRVVVDGLFTYSKLITH